MKAGRLIVGALLALPLLSAWQPNETWGFAAVAAAMFVLSSWRPASGALILVGLAPLSLWIDALIAPSPHGNRIVEILILALLSGAWVHHAFSRASIFASALARPAACMALVVGASAIVVLSVQQLGSMWLPEFVVASVRYVARDYFADPAGFPAIHNAMVLIEGVLLSALFARLAAADAATGSRLLRVALIGAAGAAACSCYRLADVSLRTAAPGRSFVPLLLTMRLAPLYGDVNAAGSYFALMTVPAAMLWAARTRGVAVRVLRRLTWTIPLALVLSALWLTRSRAAFLGIVVGAAVVLVLRSSAARRRIWLATAGVVLVLGAAGIFVLRAPSSASSADAISVRVGMTRVSLRVAADHPLFGVGIGQFPPASARYVDAALARAFPPAARGENAHNNFLQILGELGLAGLAAFAWLILAGLVPAIRRLALDRSRSPAGPGVDDADLSLAAATGGVVAFLVSCLAGHPLLTPQVSWAFFAMLGLTAGLAAPAQPDETPRRSRVSMAVIVATAMFVVAVPYRMHIARAVANLDHLAVGAIGPVMFDDGVRYQRAERRSLWFVSSETKSVDLPLKLDAGSVTPCRVEIEVDGRPANPVTPTDAGWLHTTLALGQPQAGAATFQLELRVIGDRCQLMVGRIVEHQ